MTDTRKKSSPVQLNRALSLPLVALYGLGTTIGAGIFVLIGKVSGAGGALAPLSFLVAAVVAGLSALSFAELSARYPESGGEAVYVKEGLKSDTLALCVGLLVVTAGVISTATIIVGFSGYFAEFIDLPRNATEVAIAVVLASIALSGVKFSVAVAAMITLLEIGVLLVVIGFGLPDAMSAGVVKLGAAVRDSPLSAWSGVFFGAVIAFYAFIGFEDIVNVAEETRSPERVLPAAIIVTLVVTTLLYLLVSLVVVGIFEPRELADSDAPLTSIYERLSGSSGDTISVVAIVSVLNGALIQVIMASRVLYGLSRRGWLPGPFGDVNRHTRTPAKAIVLCVSGTAGLALTLDIQFLAVSTSYVTLIVFALVNASLIAKKRRSRAAAATSFQVPGWVPVTGIALIAALVLARALG